MKKYIVPIWAVVTAIICFSFTRPVQRKKSSLGVFLVYTGANYLSSSVTNVNNWLEDPFYDQDLDCPPSFSEIPCAMYTDPLYLSGSYPNRKPNGSHILIGANTNGNGVYYPYQAYGSAPFDPYNAEYPY